MSRGPLFENGYKPLFSGHETFPLRYGWLKKVYDAVASHDDGIASKSIFSDDTAIARFGVGKNMVSSMRYWAAACEIIEDIPGNQIRIKALGHKLFGASGLDPYMESPSTLWILHWRLCGRADRTTWFWAFNHFSHLTFERDALSKGLLAIAHERGWPRVSAATVKRDVECFVRTYAAKAASAQLSHEEALESPLTELGLIRATGKKDGFRFVRGAKSSLGDGVFAYALIEFWQRYSKSKTLSFEAIAHGPGSPGRVFALDEGDLADRLSEIEDATEGLLRWSETAGLKQVIRSADLNVEAALGLVDADFRVRERMKVA
ncbi:DUF4007 family protein [Devosia marina]|uniref:DUF4007 family protein n=1 Tax=Devosia marina TaxID=2683198 RepID=A0A7X3FS28_9HYPH|nr:DUF4007 family protein [Devosia marina]MVS99777.1 DUF4007 family protein [Devosia marina]